jgi:hypothetical protein
VSPYNIFIEKMMIIKIVKNTIFTIVAMSSSGVLLFCSMVSPIAIVFVVSALLCSLHTTQDVISL